MSADVIPLRLPPPDLLASTHPGLNLGSTAAQSTITVASTAVALTIPSTIHVHALVPLDHPPPDPRQLILDNWGKPQMRKAIAVLLALHPNAPPIEGSVQQLVTAVIKFCEDPERSSWMPPPGDRTEISQAQMAAELQTKASIEPPAGGQRQRNRTGGHG